MTDRERLAEARALLCQHIGMQGPFLELLQSVGVVKSTDLVALRELRDQTRAFLAYDDHATQDTGEGHIPAAREAWRKEKESGSGGG